MMEVDGSLKVVSLIPIIDGEEEKKNKKRKGLLDQFQKEMSSLKVILEPWPEKHFVLIG